MTTTTNTERALLDQLRESQEETHAERARRLVVVAELAREQGRHRADTEYTFEVCEAALRIGSRDALKAAVELLMRGAAFGDRERSERAAKVLGRRAS